MFFTLILAAVVQAVLPLWTTMGHAKAPILLSVVIYYALCYGWGRAMIVAFIAGFLQDSSGMVPFGFSSTAFCAVAWALNHFRREMYTRHAVTHAICGFLASAAVTMFLYAGLRGAGLIDMPAGGLLLKTAGNGLLGALCAPLTFQAVMALDDKLGNPMEELR